MSNPAPDQLNPFSAPTVPAAAPLSQPRVHLAQYGTVRLGLQLIYYSIAAMVGLFVLMLVFTFAGIASGEMGLLAAIAGFVGLGIIAAGLASLVGFCMCGACPNPNERTLAFIAIFCFVAYVAAAVLSSITPIIAQTEAGSFVSMLISAIGNIASIVCTIMFCLLLKRVGKNISSQSLERKSQNALISFLVFLGFCCLGIAGMFAIGTFSGQGMPIGLEFYAGMFGLIMAALGLITLFYFLAMLRTGINELRPIQHVQA